ncbi:hypothetical protein IWQ60_010376, partial [Tieghemiomyces parasiticus]
KNYTKGYTEIQTKVRSATSNDPWGPTGAQMNEIAEATFSNHDFIEIMEIIDKRLNDKGKNWRHVFKALVVLDYCIQCGAENVANYARQNLYIVKTLKEFQHRDDSGKDQGANVRQKAKEITGLLEDEERLREARSKSSRTRHRMHGRGGLGEHDLGSPASTSSYPRSRHRPSANQRDNRSDGDEAEYGDEDRDLRRAIEESKRMAEEQERSRRESDSQLRQAIEESEHSSKGAEDQAAHQNELILTQDFDDQQYPTHQFPQQQQMVVATPSSQYDAFGSLIDTTDSTLQQQQQYHQQVQYQQMAQSDLLGGYQANAYAASNSGFSGQDASGQAMMYQQQQQQTSSFQTNPFAQTMNTTTSASSHQMQHNQSTGGGVYPGQFGSMGPATGNLLGGSLSAASTPGVAGVSTPLGNGFSPAMATAFDGGNQGKPLPYQNSSTPNALIADIARNSSRIDPFASLATSRAGSTPLQQQLVPTAGSGGANPFASSGGAGPTPGGGMDLLGGGSGGNSQALASPYASFNPSAQPSNSASLIDISADSLSNSTALTSGIGQTSGFGPSVNKNPFAPAGSSAGFSGSRTGQPSLNDLAQRPNVSGSASPLSNSRLLTQTSTTTNLQNMHYSSTSLLRGGSQPPPMGGNGGFNQAFSTPPAATAGMSSPFASYNTGSNAAPGGFGHGTPQPTTAANPFAMGGASAGGQTAGGFPTNPPPNMFGQF